jgi:hypothetical protein
MPCWFSNKTLPLPLRESVKNKFLQVNSLNEC